MRLFDSRNNYNGNLLSLLKYSTRSRFLSYIVIFFWFRQRRRRRQSNTKYSIYIAPKSPFHSNAIWMFPLWINICCESCAITICKSRYWSKIIIRLQQTTTTRKTVWISCEGGGEIRQFYRQMTVLLFAQIQRIHINIMALMLICWSCATFHFVGVKFYIFISRWVKTIRLLHFVCLLRFVSCPYMLPVINKKSHRKKYQIRTSDQRKT